MDQITRLKIRAEKDFWMAQYILFKKRYNEASIEDQKDLFALKVLIQRAVAKAEAEELMK